MSDHDAPETQPNPQADPPPIPDGGLGKGLPAWLATPPSRPVKPAGEPTPIELDALAADVKLPQWLQDLSDRVDDPVETLGDEPETEIIEAVPVEQVPEPAVAEEPVVAVVAPPDPVAVAQAEPSPGETPTRSITPYLLSVLAVIVIAALATWLIWG